MGRRSRPLGPIRSRAQRSRVRQGLIALVILAAASSVVGAAWLTTRPPVTPPLAAALAAPSTAAKGAPSPIAPVPSALGPASPPAPIAAVIGVAGRAPTAPLFLQWSDPRFHLRVPILMYHVIGPALDARHEPRDLVVPTAVFAAQMAALHAAGWRTITMSQLAIDLADARRPPRRTVVVSVDDGHLDGLTIAAPILERFGYDATFNIVVGRLNRAGYLTPAQVAELAAAGMDIGNHTIHHVDLAIQPPAILSAEIDGAERDLARIAGSPPATLAYPSGEQNAAVVAAVAAAGLDLAVTTRLGAFEDFANRFVLPRIRIHPSTTPGELLATLTRLVG